eukprot:s2156_g6.t1
MVLQMRRPVFVTEQLFRGILAPCKAVHDQVIRDFHPIVTDVLVHVDPDGSPQSHRLETHSEVGNMADQMMMNPEDLRNPPGPAPLQELEAQIREALLQDPGHAGVHGAACPYAPERRTLTKTFRAYWR